MDERSGPSRPQKTSSFFLNKIKNEFKSEWKLFWKSLFSKNKMPQDFLEMDGVSSADMKTLLQQLSHERHLLNQRLEEIREQSVDQMSEELMSEGLSIAEKLSLIDLQLKKLHKHQGNPRYLGNKSN